jgi:hypothetical protein
MQSAFFSKFSLVELTWNNSSEWGLLCDETGGHGPGVSGQSSGAKGSRQRLSEGFTCQIVEADDDRFNETGFLDSLKAAIERDVKSSGAFVTREGSSNSSGFYVEYSDGDTHGRLEISGKSIGNQYYDVAASIDERHQMP